MQESTSSKSSFPGMYVSAHYAKGSRNSVVFV